MSLSDEDDGVCQRKQGQVEYRVWIPFCPHKVSLGLKKQLELPGW